jgi:hypothetical protein
MDGLGLILVILSFRGGQGNSEWPFLRPAEKRVQADLWADFFHIERSKKETKKTRKRGEALPGVRWMVRKYSAG